MDRKFSYIYGPPRGGLPLAVCLSHRLDLKLTVSSPLSIQIQADADFAKDVRENALIVDDIADTGKTLKEFREAGYFIATLFWHRQSAVKPEIAIREKGNFWIQFPWEVK